MSLLSFINYLSLLFLLLSLSTVHFLLFILLSLSSSLCLVSFWPCSFPWLWLSACTLTSPTQQRRRHWVLWSTAEAVIYSVMTWGRSKMDTFVCVVIPELLHLKCTHLLFTKTISLHVCVTLCVPLSANTTWQDLSSFSWGQQATMLVRSNSRGCWVMRLLTRRWSEPYSWKLHLSRDKPGQPEIWPQRAKNTTMRHIHVWLKLKNQTKISNTAWFQFLKYEDLLLFIVIWISVEWKK